MLGAQALLYLDHPLLPLPLHGQSPATHDGAIRHQVGKTQLKRQPDIAEAFYWQEEPRTLKEKYGKAEPQVKQLYNDFQEWLVATQPGAPETTAAPRKNAVRESAARA